MTDTVAGAIRAAAERLSATSDTARLDAELLMAHALGVSRSELLLERMRDAAPEAFPPMIERRAKREPVSYITGFTEFYGRSFAVTPDVLIPRSDSETLVDVALDLIPERGRVLDMGTGSGALLLSVLLETQSTRGVGIDSSEAALNVARYNGRVLDPQPHHRFMGPRQRFLLRSWHKPDWATDLGRFDLILCNPPYIEEDAALDPDVRDYEPASALFAGPEGLDDYRAIIPQLGKLLCRVGLPCSKSARLKRIALLPLPATRGLKPSSATTSLDARAH